MISHYLRDRAFGAAVLRRGVGRVSRSTTAASAPRRAPLRKRGNAGGVACQTHRGAIPDRRRLQGRHWDIARGAAFGAHSAVRSRLGRQLGVAWLIWGALAGALPAADAALSSERPRPALPPERWSAAATRWWLRRCDRGGGFAGYQRRNAGRISNGSSSATRRSANQSGVLLDAQQVADLAGSSRWRRRRPRRRGARAGRER